LITAALLGLFFKNMEKKMHLILLTSAALIIAFSIAYYFLYSLPDYNEQRLTLQKQKQAADLQAALDKAAMDKHQQASADEQQMLDVAKNIQDDCIKSVQSGVVYYFGRTNVAESPLFYQNENEESFNMDERLLTSLDAYRSCLNNDPRNDGNNSAIASMLGEANSAYKEINNYMVTYRDNTPGLCDSYLLSEPAKSKCPDLFKMSY
jgi:hypothetical protein